MRSVMRSNVTRSGDRIMEPLAEVDEGLHAEAQRAGLVVLPVLVLEHGARDVQVGPGRPWGHELAEEEARGDGARQPAGRDVVEVRVGRLEGVLVLLDERQL